MCLKRHSPTKLRCRQTSTPSFRWPIFSRVQTASSSRRPAAKKLCARPNGTGSRIEAGWPPPVGRPLSRPLMLPHGQMAPKMEQTINMSRDRIFTSIELGLSSWPRRLTEVAVRDSLPLPERLSGTPCRSGCPELPAGATVRDSLPERLSGTPCRSGCPELPAGATVRNSLPERLSGTPAGAAVRDSLPERLSGTPCRSDCPGLPAGAAVRDSLPERL